MFASSARRVRFSPPQNGYRFRKARAPYGARRRIRRDLALEILEQRAMLAVVPLVTETTPSRGIVVTQVIYDDAGIDWNGSDESFDDSAWTASAVGGPNGIGAPITPGAKYSAFASINAAAMVGTTNTSFLRVPFNVADADLVEGLTLKMRFDDGFIAYLNGVEVARQNAAPDAYPAWSAAAAAFAQDASAAFTMYDISAHAGALRDGANVLAVRGFDRPQVGSFPVTQDFVIQATLDADLAEPTTTTIDDSAVTPTDAPTTIDVLANDLPGAYPINPATVQVVQTPAHGTYATNPTTGAITYTPEVGFRGTDTFTYRVRDTAGVSLPGEPTTPVTVVSTTAAHRRLVPTGPIADAWTGSGAFNDSTWLVGTGGVGYDTDPSVDYEPFIQNGLVTMQNINGSVFVRYPFTVANPDGVAGLRLRMRYEDGFVAWINGVQIVSASAPSSPTWNSLATGGARNEAQAVMQDEFEIDLGAAGVVLKPGAGANILAIQGLNDTIASTDLMVQPELIADVGPTGRWSNEATVTVTVQGVGPLAVDDEAQTAGTAPVAIPVLANDEPGDPPNDFPLRPESVSIVTPPTNGTATVAPETGAITYEAKSGFSGVDTLEYTVRDAAPVGGDTGNVEIVPISAVWKYLDDGTDQGTTWRDTEFDDSAWMSGPAELGYGDGDEATVVSFGGNSNAKYITTYFRHAFDLADAGAVERLELSTVYDDGAVIYLNGTEVGRAGMPTGPVTSQTPAIFAGEESTVTFSLESAQLGTLRDGINVIAVEIHQSHSTSSDISFALRANADVDAPTGRLSNPATVTIAVASTDEAPIAGDDAAITKGAQPVTIDVLANDVPRGAFLDLGSVAIVAAPQHGTAEVLASGSIVYTPNADYLGDDSFTYTVEDLDGRVSNAATVSIEIVSSIVTAGDDLYFVDEDDVLNISASFGVLTNDASDGGDVETAIVVAPPQHGTLALAADGGFQYIPAANFAGDDQFTYRAEDGFGVGDEATVTIRVNASPDAPLAFGDVFSTAAGAPLVVVAAPAERQVLIPAGSTWRYLDDGSNLSSSWRTLEYDDTTWSTGQAQFGYGDGDETTVINFGGDVNNRHVTTFFRRELTINALSEIHTLRLDLLRDDGAIVYLNNTTVVASNASSPGQNSLAHSAVAGDEENTFLPFDLNLARLVSGRNILAVEVHQASATSNDMSFDLYLHGDVAGPVSGGVLFNDVDPDGDYMTARLVDPPAHGTLTFTADGGFTYAPNAGFVGSDSFTYRATDGERLSELATVVINVTPPPFMAADLNEDGIVDVADVAMVVAGFGMGQGADRYAGDVNGDGFVNLNDAIAVQQAMGQKADDGAAAPGALVAGRRALADDAMRVRTDRAEAGLAARAARRGGAAASDRGETFTLDARSVDRAIGRVAASLAESLRAVRRR